MGHDMLGQKARSKKAQTPELQSILTVEYLYPDNPAVYDSIRSRHSSAIVTMSWFPQSLCVNESVLFNMSRPHQACYGVDIMVGSTPQVGQRTQLGAQNAVEAKQNLYYIIHDNRHIHNPVYPTPRVQNNQPR